MRRILFAACSATLALANGQALAASVSGGSLAPGTAILEANNSCEAWNVVVSGCAPAAPFPFTKGGIPTLDTTEIFTKGGLTYGEATATVTHDPTLTAEVYLNPKDSLGVDASATLTYQVRVNGPAGMPVTLTVHGSFEGSDNTSGSAIVGQDSYTLSGPDGTNVSGTELINSSTAPMTPFGKEISVVSGTVYTLTLYTEAYIELYLGDCCNNGPTGKVTGGVDPTLSIDPSTPDASAFTLQFSPGFGGSVGSAVPESSTWAMMGLGFVGLGLLGANGARKARALSRVS
jgi:hypothetical protein